MGLPVKGPEKNISKTCFQLLEQPPNLYLVDLTKSLGSPI